MPDEAQAVWRNQPREGRNMATQEIRGRAQRFEAKARLQAMASIVLGLGMTVACGWYATGIGEILPQLGFIVLCVWSLYFAWQAYRWNWPGRAPEHADLLTSARLYRQELERRRDYVHHVWRRSGMTLAFVGFGLIFAGALKRFIAQPKLLLYGSASIVLLAFWVVAFSFQRRGNQRNIERDLRDLDALEAGTGQR